MKPVVFLSSARADLRAGVSYFRRIDAVLGLRFVQAVEISAQALAQFPEAMQVLEAEIRRWPVKGFPHGVLYRIEDERIVILAVFHPRRDPALWRDRAKT